MAGMMDFLQSASNEAAGTVAAPVDIIAWLMRKAGMPVQQPVGGSEWMGAKGLTRPVKQSAASLAGSTAGLLSPVAAAAKAPQIARGLLQAGDNLAAPRTLNPQTGAIVWHGSPHKFDKFDSSKIGTGEGAQAYGHGLYLADSPTVAGGYKETLTARVKDRLTIDGKVVDPDSMLGRAAEDVPRIGLQATLQKIDDNIRFNEKYAPDMAEMYRGVRAQIASLDPARVAVKEGSLYKVDLPDDQIARMLDWDKPLSQQANAAPMLDALQAAPELPSGFGQAIAAARARKHFDGNDLFAELVKVMPNAQASQVMSRAGFQGIRYLDGGSRGAGTGTSNYVVFPGNENLLKILERNGQSLP